MTSLPGPPRTFERRTLEETGFRGWRTWAELAENACADAPDAPATYVVYRPHATTPRFLTNSCGGRFKGRDPTVDVAVLRAKWVPGSNVVYIGKADRARRRLTQFARFGAGEPVGHWGGRYIWQLADHQELLVAWQALTWPESARDYERRLLARFARLNAGRRPFANLTG